MYNFLFLCLFTHLLFVMCYRGMCSCTLRKTKLGVCVRRCECAVYVRCKNYGVRGVWNSYLSVNKVKVKKGALTYLIYSEMEKRNWIRGKTQRCTNAPVPVLGKAEKLLPMCFKDSACCWATKALKKSECVCVWEDETKWQSYFFSNAKSIFALSIH